MPYLVIVETDPSFDRDLGGTGDGAASRERKVYLDTMVRTTGELTRELFEAYRQHGDLKAKEQVISNYTPLVRSLCRRFRPSREPQEDLLQVGMIGLLNSIRKFDPDRGTSFSSLAIPEILGAIMNYLRDHGSLIKVPP